jgi:chondroitin AC lyase
MQMLWGNQRHARGYSVHVWDDARRGWITLGSTASGDGDDTWTVRGNVSVRGRYFMLWLANPYIMGGHYELREWRISAVGAGGSGGGTNLAVGRPIQALSQDPAYPATNAVDGNASTEWRPSGLPVWIYVDLGSSQTIDRAILRWATGLHGTDYTLYAWNGTSWSPLYTQRSGRGGDETVSFRAVRSQYVLLYVAQGAGTTVGLRELEVYAQGTSGGGGGMVTPTPPLPPIPFAHGTELEQGLGMALDRSALVLEGQPAGDALPGVGPSAPASAPRPDEAGTARQ